MFSTPAAFTNLPNLVLLEILLTILPALVDAVAAFVAVLTPLPSFPKSEVPALPGIRRERDDITEGALLIHQPKSRAPPVLIVEPSSFL